MAELSGVEWDDAKRRANIAKHGIDFSDAAEAFNDPEQFTYRSKHPSEERFVSVGKVKGRLIAVVFTMRGDKARLISARRARENERYRYGRQE